MKIFSHWRLQPVNISVCLSSWGKKIYIQEFDFGVYFTMRNPTFPEYEPNRVKGEWIQLEEGVGILSRLAPVSSD